MKTNYFKIGLYMAGTIAVFVAGYMIFRAFKRAGSGIASIGDTIQDNRVNKEIAQQANIPVAEVDNARKIANQLAEEMELRKGMTWWQKQQNLVTDSEILDIAAQVKSAAQMRAISHIFQNELTLNKNLYTELKSELSGKNLSKVPFIESIIN